jgi:NADH:ubiquinone oxidoreductase subunit 2 (subunit N)
MAKWLLLRAALEAGQWWWLAIILLGGLLAAGYMFRVLGYALLNPDPAGAAEAHGTPLTPLQELVPLVLGLLAVGLGFAGLPLLAILDLGSPFEGARP